LRSLTVTIKMEQHVMTYIVYENNASIPRWMIIMNESLPYLTRYTAILRIITIDMCLKYQVPSLGIWMSYRTSLGILHM
jgi:hypothetical protein